MKKVLFVVLAIVMMPVMASCMEASNSGNGGKIDIRGQITKVSMNDNKAVAAILVEGTVESDTVHDKASVRIDKKTKITSGNDGKKLTAGDLKEGMKVEVLFDGPVAESYPVQAKAKTIKVIE